MFIGWTVAAAITVGIVEVGIVERTGDRTGIERASGAGTTIGIALVAGILFGAAPGAGWGRVIPFVITGRLCSGRGTGTAVAVRSGRTRLSLAGKERLGRTIVP